jgi:hypothetical protein
VSLGRRSTPAARSEAGGHTRGQRAAAAALMVALFGPWGLCALGEGRALAREPAFLEFPSVEPVMTRRSPNLQGRGSAPELELSLEFASAYVFRGYNVFQAENQREQHWVQRPQIVWTAPGTGFSIGYAAANQLTGDNLVGNVAAGLGGEQDLFSSYEFGRTARAGLATELVVVAYPAADKRVIGTELPVFVSVSAEPRYRHNLFLYLGYLRGFRHGSFEANQVYLNPRVEKRFSWSERFELELQLGAGMKILASDLTVRDNMFDVLATTTLYYALNDVFYIGAKVGWAWTNMKAQRDPDTGQVFTPRFSDEYVPFWSLSVGAEFWSGAATIKGD